MAMKLKAKIVSVSDVSLADRTRMFALMRKYYEKVKSEEFEKDLAKKNAVILLRDRGTGQIQGFSTLMSRGLEVYGLKFRAIFSGDTVVEKDYWGNRALGSAFLKYLFVEAIKRPHRPVFWFLISKGYKTYLMMANNFPEHYPRYEKPTPAIHKAMMDLFYGSLYPENYQEELGLIRFPDASCHLRTGIAEVTPQLLAAKPRAAFFVRKNPNWAQGAELCCIARMTLTMPFKYGMKGVCQSLVSWVPEWVPRLLPGSSGTRRASSSSEVVHES